jgi:glutaconate CoA-transferase, subunit B
MGACVLWASGCRARRQIWRGGGNGGAKVRGRGATTVISDLGVLVSDPATNELVLTAVHPGVSVEQERNATGWELRVVANLQITPKPNASELAALRDLQARTAAAHGGAAGAE